VADRSPYQAALLDRDGTIVVDREYLRDPDEVELLPGAAEAIRLLAGAGIPSIVCTNQSGIARGLVSVREYGAVRRRMAELLAAEGASLLDTFSCPHHPDFSGSCDCRKPATGLYERAAALYRLDLSRCLFVGDRHRDVAPAAAFGGRALLVRSTITPAADLARAEADAVPQADSLLAAVRLALAGAAP
jgi:D-glycero-D-manno-heptose 1,7-bisphosphate phosphatase